MDPAANPAVHVRPSTDGRVYEEPEEVWDGLVRTVSRVTGRSRRESDAEKYAQVGEGDEFAAPRQVKADRRKDNRTINEETASQIARDTFPEGGLRAWLVVVSAWLLLFPSFGFMV